MSIMHIVSTQRLRGDVIFRSDYLGSDLARKSMRGGITSVASQGVQFALSVIQTIFLARLLTPHDFGLVGMVSVIISFANMFKNAGLSMATIQSERITPSQISTLFWVNITLSTMLGICLMAISPLVASFYHQPELTGLTVGLAISFMINGLAIQHLALLYRHVRFGALAVITIVSSAIGLIVSITLAVLGWRYWALVGGSLVGTLVATLLTFYFCPWVPGRFQKGTGSWKMLVFGGNLTVGNVANYISGNMDNILIGRFIGADALGLYAKAYQLFLLPIKQVRDPLQNIALPMLSSLSNQPELYRDYYRRFLDLLASMTIPMAMYCLVEADFVIRVFLGTKWLDAIPVFRVFALVALVYPLAGTQGLILISLGKSRRFLGWNVITAGLSVLSFIAGLPFGIVGVAAGFAIMNYVFLVPSLLYCLQGTCVSTGLFLRTIISPLFAGLLATGAALLVRSVGWRESPVAHILVVVVFSVIYLGLSFSRSSFRKAVYQLIGDLPHTWLRRTEEAQHVSASISAKG